MHHGGYWCHDISHYFVKYKIKDDYISAIERNRVGQG